MTTPTVELTQYVIRRVGSPQQLVPSRRAQGLLKPKWQLAMASLRCNKSVSAPLALRPRSTSPFLAQRGLAEHP